MVDVIELIKMELTCVVMPVVSGAVNDKQKDEINSCVKYTGIIC